MGFGSACGTTEVACKKARFLQSLEFCVDVFRRSISRTHTISCLRELEKSLLQADVIYFISEAVSV